LRTTCYGFGDRSSTRIRCLIVSLAAKDRGQHRCPLTFYKAASGICRLSAIPWQRYCLRRAGITKHVLRGFGIADGRDV
jgi:hypothetical protein